MKIGDRIGVMLKQETRIGHVTDRRLTEYGPVVTVEFWHAGRRESREFHVSDPALVLLGRHE